MFPGGMNPAKMQSDQFFKLEGLTSWKGSLRGKAHFVERLSFAGDLAVFVNLLNGGKV